MEHLSAEERACLMYLEETIEALEVQEDSGLSNDEPDAGFHTDKMGRLRVNDISSFKSDDQKSESGSRVLTVGDKAEHLAPNHNLEPQFSPGPAANMKYFETSENFVTQPEPPVTESDGKIHPTATELCVTKDEDGNLKIVPSASLCTDQSTATSDMDVGVIPPPSDFRDEPAPPPQSQRVKDLLTSAGSSVNKPGGPIDLELLRQRASSKSFPVIQEPPNKPPDLSLPAASSGPPTGPPPEPTEPRSPPAVAPKPKKLPANIILKSHKAAVADGNSSHPVSASSDRVLLDPQRVRIEALIKLGLLPADADPGPAFSPKLSPKTRRSWAAPPSPVSPAASHTPPSTPSTPSYTRVSSPSPAPVPLQAPAPVPPPDTSPAPAVLPIEFLPAPPAFSDPVESPLSESELSAVKDASEAAVNAQINTPPLIPPAAVNHLTPPKVIGVKSATLERSGLGLSSYMASQDFSEGSQGVNGERSPSQLRNTRARPASLGSRKEFSSAHGEGLQIRRATSKESDVHRSLSGPQHSGDSQKLPRSQGISVLICPRSENEEDRREALKKLGLLRD
ncbi:specifically androgen-regulated gene protein isoform X2 [Plectropomus leopardus]|nr:specifically androgen-regulated gene protein isoform X2 [Plectropomus leopardus]